MSLGDAAAHALSHPGQEPNRRGDVHCPSCGRTYYRAHDGCPACDDDLRVPMVA